MLTLVMYHYVRDLPNTPYPAIKGLLTRNFQGQLDYLQKHYTIVDIRDVSRSAVTSERSLPSNACLLTFDDGFIDHYETVFPELRRRGLTASFYPPGCSSIEHEVLDVHKIHFILASGREPAAIKASLLDEIAHFRRDEELPGDDELEARYAMGNRYDSADVDFIKNVLQKGLPERVRSHITARLFNHCVSGDEAGFARELYMSIPQMREMIAAGMVIGGHGYRHNWLGTLSRDDQAQDVRRMLAFLETVYGAVPRNWAMCYPYGSYDPATLEILREAGAALGLTTVQGLVSDLSRPLELSRLDTIDLPFDGDAPLSRWTERARA